MLFGKIRTLVAGAVVAASIGITSQAEAGWRHHHHGYGGYGYGSCGSSGGSWGSSGGSWGSSGGSWGSYGSSGSYGSYGSSGGWHHHGSWGGSSGWYGSSGSWGSSGGSSGSYGGSYSGGYGVQVIDQMPVQPGTVVPPASPAPSGPNMQPGPAPSPEPPAAPAPPNTTLRSTLQGNSVLLTVKVPAAAKVYVNGHLTSSTGAERQYISRGLVAGGRYSYEVRAEIEVNGKTVSDVKTVQLTSGEVADLAFNLNSENDMQATSPTVTKVTVHVPAGARLFLAGQEASGSGEVREFSTSRLAPGAEWTSYTVRAEIERDGQVVSREQTLSLKAGDSRELSFDFGSENIANTTSSTASR